MAASKEEVKPPSLVECYDKVWKMLSRPIIVEFRVKGRLVRKSIDYVI